MAVGKLLDWAFSHFHLETKRELYAAFWREAASRAEAQELSGKPSWLVVSGTHPEGYKEMSSILAVQ